MPDDRRVPCPNCLATTSEGAYTPCAECVKLVFAPSPATFGLDLLSDEEFLAQEPDQHGHRKCAVRECPHRGTIRRRCWEHAGDLVPYCKSCGNHTTSADRYCQTLACREAFRKELARDTA